MRRNFSYGTLALIAIVCVVLYVAFPRVARFLTIAAMEIRYLWWLILASLLSGYLVYYISRKR